MCIVATCADQGVAVPKNGPNFIGTERNGTEFLGTIGTEPERPSVLDRPSVQGRNSSERGTESVGMIGTKPERPLQNVKLTAQVAHSCRQIPASTMYYTSVHVQMYQNVIVLMAG